MNEEGFDYAIAGDTTFAALLGLFLAKAHGARVCLIGPMPAPLQLLREVALSLGPYTRPETLEVLGKGVDEVRALIGGRGEPVLERRNVLFTALSPEGQDAAGHVRHMLASTGAITASQPAGDGPAGFIVEGVWHVRPRVFFAGLAARLTAAGIVHHPDACDLQVGHDCVRLMAGHSFVSAKKLIVTGPGQSVALPEGVVVQSRTAFLTNPVPRAAGRLVIDIATGGHVLAHADGRLEAAVPTGEAGESRDALGRLLPPTTQARVVASTRFPVLLSRDGAPLLGHIPHKAAMLAIGFGVSGGFFAPALARHLSLAATPGESAYFAARMANADRAEIADVGLVGGGTP